MKLCLNCFQPMDEHARVCPHCGYRQASPPRLSYYMTPGTVLHERYIVGTAIGAGGFSVTYHGYDAQLRQIIAIKEYMPGELCTRFSGETNITVYDDAEKKMQFLKGKEKFSEEAKRMARFRGTKNIVQIFNTFEDNGTAYIIMEYVQGETLEHYIKRRGHISVEEALTIIMPVLAALNAIHQVNMLHRDVTPSNIMITEDKHVKLLDFGSARYATANYSKSMTVLYKEGFTPEEQYLSNGEQGPWSDVYSAGATFYYMITGLKLESALDRRLNDDIIKPSKLGIEISPNVENALMNALSVDYHQRTPTARKFMTELSSDATVVSIFKRTKQKKTVIVPKWLKIVTPIVLGALVIVCVLIKNGVGLSFASNASSGISKNEVEMPRLVGMNVSNAVKKLDQEEISYRLKKKTSEDYSKNEVYNQSVKAGAIINKKNNKVVLYYSTGGKDITMPYVVGREMKSVMSELRKEGIKKISLTYKKSDTFAKGAIIDTSVEENHSYNTAELLNLTVSDGSKTTNDGKSTTVPDLTGEDIDDLDETLKAKGLHIMVRSYQHAYTQGVGTIISQNRLANSKIERGSTIYVNVSSGKKQVVIPDVRGLTVTEAKNKLSSLNLQYDEKRVYSDRVAEGHVIAQDVMNKTVEEKTTVTCTVSKGSEPFAMPDVLGKSKEGAETTLENKGLNVNAVYKETSDSDVGLGKVWWQTYKAGSSVRKGMTVTLYVRKVVIKKENFVGGQVYDATAVLSKAGLKYKIKKEYSDEYEAGLVTGISPVGDIKEDKEITLTVSKGVDPQSIIDEIQETDQNKKETVSG